MLQPGAFCEQNANAAGAPPRTMHWGDYSALQTPELILRGPLCGVQRRGKGGMEREGRGKKRLGMGREGG